jgi:hypothetical protein
METERVGNDTIGQMSRQREQIENANSNATRTRQIAVQATILVRDMSRKALRNRMCLYIMIAFLIVGNLWAFVRLLKK